MLMLLKIPGEILLVDDGSTLEELDSLFGHLDRCVCPLPPTFDQASMVKPRWQEQISRSLPTHLVAFMLYVTCNVC